MPRDVESLTALYNDEVHHQDWLGGTVGQLALYDLEADPTEQEDVVIEQPQVLESTSSDLLGWLDHAHGSLRDLPRFAPPTECTDAVW